MVHVTAGPIWFQIVWEQGHSSSQADAVIGAWSGGGRDTCYIDTREENSNAWDAEFSS